MRRRASLEHRANSAGVRKTRSRAALGNDAPRQRPTSGGRGAAGPRSTLHACTTSSENVGLSERILAFEQIDAPLIVAFLDDLERHGLSIRSRNLRLTAFHSFFRYAAFELPTHAAQIQRVLAIPSQRFTRTLVPFLTRAGSADLVGRRDHALLLVAVQIGLRVSEMTGLTRRDVVLGTGAHVRVIDKGRNERCTPLARPTRAVREAWLREPVGGRRTSSFRVPRAVDSRFTASSTC